MVGTREVSFEREREGGREREGEREVGEEEGKRSGPERKMRAGKKAR